MRFDCLLQVRLSRAHKLRLELLAREQQTSVATVVRQIVLDRLESVQRGETDATSEQTVRKA